MNILARIQFIESREQPCEMPYWSTWNQLGLPEDLLESMMDTAHHFFPNADLDLMAQADSFSDKGFELLMSVAITQNLSAIYAYWKEYYAGEEVEFDDFVMGLRKEAQDGGYTGETDCRDICCITGKTLANYPTQVLDIVEEIKHIGQGWGVDQDDYNWLNLVITNFRENAEVLEAIAALPFGGLNPEELPF